MKVLKEKERSQSYKLKLYLHEGWQASVTLTFLFESFSSNENISIQGVPKYIVMGKKAVIRRREIYFSLYVLCSLKFIPCTYIAYSRY